MWNPKSSLISAILYSAKFLPYSMIISLPRLMYLKPLWALDNICKSSCLHAVLQEADQSVKSHGLNMWQGGLLMAIWLAVLLVTVILGSTLANPPITLKWWEVFYRTGSIIYGGGQVVLPMLYTDVVQRTCEGPSGCRDAPNTWVTSEQFYAGIGIAQAMPGPLFNFSAYLGAIMAMRAGYVFIVGTLLAWFGLFGPGVMLIFGE
eukprot:GHUV01043606.1.p1 GENE.GHUV01043606.1~~GHUV01043606.1.p1  ORF type:complete len:205 (+),score=11.55 GHUV01043606.1:184-798(+)